MAETTPAGEAPTAATPSTTTPTTTTTTTTTPAATTTAHPAAAADPSDAGKPIHTLVLDTGPLIKNDPPVSTLLAQAECLVTTPAVVAEIRDAATRARVETTLLPFVTLRTPRAASVQFVTDFARRTGDLDVLSRPDLQLLALTYEVECERNGGDWRLRSSPTQKGVNGKSPAAEAAEKAKAEEGAAEGAAETAAEEGAAEEGAAETAEETSEATAETSEATAETSEATAETSEATAETSEATAETSEAPLDAQVAGLSIEEGEAEAEADAADDADDSGGEWITPSNLKKVQEKEQRGGAPTRAIEARLQAALLTSDYAMQNVALRVNLNLVSPALARITRVKTWVLRCHGCFAVTRQMDKQFCPSCGQATLTRASCSTDGATGAFRVHLKRNFQHNKRGNVYSVPKPAHGSASGKLTDPRGGGRHGWGRDLILSEDQREYTRKAEEQRRARVRDLMDDDYLPGLLTGYRNAAQQRIRVGAGRNVNAKKRK